MKQEISPPAARIALRWAAAAAAGALVVGGGVVAVAATGSQSDASAADITATVAANEHAAMANGEHDGEHSQQAAPGADTGKYSVAYLERNWKPTSYDSCSAELHASYQTTGPDGKIYPSWHPATVTDPATGKECTFGHEHGDDPSTSQIFDWVVDYLSPEDGEKASDLPFGYASEQLDAYASEHQGMSMRHEDNAGHKVFVANDVKLLNEDRTELLDGDGKQVTCDFLIKQHQGSWSPDATSNNAHEVIYASKCTDGTEIISTMLSRFGNSNEFNKNCGDQSAVSTVGSTLPAGDGGSRLIPTAECLAEASADGSLATWDLYELWKGLNEMTAADGTVLATYEPWFGLRNPSRYFDPAQGTATTNGVSRPLDLAWGANPVATDAWRQPAGEEQYSYQDPRSPFNGATRDFYILQNQVPEDTAGTWYTDPYGKEGAHATFNGAIKQHLASGTATTGTALAGWRSPIVEHGTGNGVHSPN